MPSLASCHAGPSADRSPLPCLVPNGSLLCRRSCDGHRCRPADLPGDRRGHLGRGYHPLSELGGRAGAAPAARVLAGFRAGRGPGGPQRPGPLPLGLPAVPGPLGAGGGAPEAARAAGRRPVPDPRRPVLPVPARRPRHAAMVRAGTARAGGGLAPCRAAAVRSVERAAVTARPTDPTPTGPGEGRLSGPAVLPRPANPTLRRSKSVKATIEGNELVIRLP